MFDFFKKIFSYKMSAVEDDVSPKPLITEGEAGGASGQEQKLPLPEFVGEVKGLLRPSDRAVVSLNKALITPQDIMDGNIQEFQSPDGSPRRIITLRLPNERRLLVFQGVDPLDPIPGQHEEVDPKLRQLYPESCTVVLDYLPGRAENSHGPRETIVKSVKPSDENPAGVELMYRTCPPERSTRYVKSLEQLPQTRTVKAVPRSVA